MKNYKVSLEIELNADNPYEAAKNLEDWCRTGDKFVYIVQDDQTGEIVSVDLTEEDENAVIPIPDSDYQPLIIATMHKATPHKS